MMKGKRGNKMKGVKSKKNQDKAVVEEEETPTYNILIDFPNSVKPGL